MRRKFENPEERQDERGERHGRGPHRGHHSHGDDHHGRHGHHMGPIGRAFARRGFGGMRGRHGAENEPMRRGKLLRSEELHLIILRLLSEKPRHGYEIIKAIEEQSSGVYAPSPGMIYPVLTYLEEMGHAVSTLDGNKKRFDLTDDGRAYLLKHQDEASEIWDEIRRYGEKIAAYQDQVNEEKVAAERWGGGREGAELREAFHDLRHELKEALFSKRDASAEEKTRVLDILRKAVAAIRTPV